MDGRKILIKYYFPEPTGHGAPSETDENKVIPEHITVKFQNTTDKREKKNNPCQESGIKVLLNVSMMAFKDR